ncbi:MAG TPA: alpha-L-fucosidase [Phycisphaerae bacterium]|nr:alpha-L-fucosidase [Phycisphaerae bacterium]
MGLRRYIAAVSIITLSVFVNVALALEFQDQIVGDTMPGWISRGNEPTEAWFVRDGVLECTGAGKLWGEWWGTEREYTDVCIDLEYKLSPGANSGIYLRTPAVGHPSSVSYEIQLLDDDAEKHQHLKPAQFTGSVYKVVAPEKRAAKPAGEWNHIRVTADGDRIVVVLNGETIVDATSREYPEFLNRSTRGFIGLQNHHTPVWFRNIRVADLAADRAARSAWFRDAKFGLFVHWGIYSVLGEGEWNMKVSRIPAAEYEKLAPQFNPTGFNATEWVSLAKRAGQKYIVFTSKHHDGFAMFDSAVSNYDMIDATPFKRDPVNELAQACAEQGLRFGLYHSILDWHHPDYEPVPDWDPARGNVKPDFDRYLAYLTAQVRELATGYGPLACWWWDGAWGHEDAVGRRKLAAINALIRELQPGILINNRGANAEDFDTPEQYIPPTGLTNPDGSPKLWENCITLTTGHGSHAPTAWWGYDKNETEYKTADYCIRMLVDVVSKGGNLLLNVGPTPEGRIQKVEADVLEAMGRWLDVNGEAIYGTTASPFKLLPFFGRATVKGNTLYVHIFGWPSERRIVLPGLINSVVRARLLGAATDAAAPVVSRQGSDTIVSLPEKAPHPVASVVALELDGPPNVQPFTIRPGPDGGISLPATVAEIRSQHGQRARFEAVGEQVYVGNWTNAIDAVSWQFEVDTPGRYQVVLNYAAPQGSAGATFEIAAIVADPKLATRPAEATVPRLFDRASASAKLSGTVEVTGGTTNFQDRAVGTIELPAGTNVLLVRPVKLPAKDTLMNLRQAKLAPAK